MKLAFVIQRYGADIAGGSEAHCRQLAERLAGRHDITVLTTRARDYVTWADSYAAGETVDNGVRVLRFPVARPRRLKVFADLTDEVFDGRAPRERQDAWFRENGPDVPSLLDHLRTRGREYDLVLFWTFRYAPSYFGLPLVADRAVLVPTAEEDPAVQLDVLQDYFTAPAGYLFLTPEEEQLVSRRAGRPLRPSVVAGMGLDPASDDSASLDPSSHDAASRARLDRLGVPPVYLLYLGRIDRNKGCDTLFAHFQDYAASRPDVALVLAGPAKMQVPGHPRIHALGYVDDDTRSALLAHARALVVPSRYESLSIVLLEGWNHALPALVNGRCRVLAGQVTRANGGLRYDSSAEFQEAADYLLTRPVERDLLGRQGLSYVEREYRWPVVLNRVEGLLDEVNRARRG